MRLIFAPFNPGLSFHAPQAEDAMLLLSKPSEMSKLQSGLAQILLGTERPAFHLERQT